VSESLKWVKAKASGSSGGSCVEVGSDGQAPVVHVRDTKSRERGMITTSAAHWQTFMDEIKAGRVNLSRLREQRSAPACQRCMPGLTCIPRWGKESCGDHTAQRGTFMRLTAMPWLVRGLP
jgi:Domain of unknown function (DUF397)